MAFFAIEMQRKKGDPTPRQFALLISLRGGVEALMRWAGMEAAASGDDYAAAVEADDTASAAAGAESAGGHHEAGHTVSGLHGPLRCSDKRDGFQLSMQWPTQRVLPLARTTCVHPGRLHRRPACPVLGSTTRSAGRREGRTGSSCAGSRTRPSPRRRSDIPRTPTCGARPNSVQSGCHRPHCFRSPRAPVQRRVRHGRKFKPPVPKAGGFLRSCYVPTPIPCAAHAPMWDLRSHRRPSARPPAGTRCAAARMWSACLW